MERFKGLAILATNRAQGPRRGLPAPAALRRRVPAAGRRASGERIWRDGDPAARRRVRLDFDFLARQFPLAGGHIRSIVFNACLQRPGEGADGADDGQAIVRAVQREYDKLKRSVSLEQFGPYTPLVEGIGQ